MSIINPLSIKGLPQTSSARSGWPWTEQSQSLPEKMPDGSEWPRISVVTPSYNQGEFIEETIRSVLLQGYPNLEYIIIDGGSTDGSIEIIQKYKIFISYWISEKDRGQSHAINKGFAKASGDILCWINSDDMLKPDALAFVARVLKESSKPQWMVGASEIINSEGNYITIRKPGNISFKRAVYWHRNWFPQQSTFWTRAMWNAVDPLNGELHYVMDFDLWLRMMAIAIPITTEKVLSCYRFQPNAKCITGTAKGFEETLWVLENYLNNVLKGDGIDKSYHNYFWDNSFTLLQGIKQCKEFEIECLQNEITGLQNEIAAMKTSAFWKLRDKWFAVKRFLGLTQEQ